LLFSMLGSGEGYRTCAYLNVLLVVVYSVRFVSKKHFVPWKHILVVLWIPLVFILLHLLAGGEITGVKLMTRIWLVVFFTFGWLMLAHNPDRPQWETVVNSLILLVSLFVVIEFMAYALNAAQYIKSWRYGTLNNPHHLALYILITVPFIVYVTISRDGPVRYWLMLLMALEAWMLLKTSSRPAWIGLLAGGMALIPFIAGRRKFIGLAILIAVPVLLYFLGPMQFHDRVQDLIEHITTEERVAIWTDTWHMQQASSAMEWMRGHGFESFTETFKSYSSFHSKSTDFVFPHNFFLELLYKSGVIGLLLAITMYVVLFRGIIRVGINSPDPQMRLLALLLLSTMVMHFVHTFLVLPFFSHYNLFLLALFFAARHLLMQRHPVVK